MKARIVSLVLLSISITGCNSTVPPGEVIPFVQPPVAKSPAELNANTSRAKRTEYECRLATSSKDKALPVGLDFFRMSMDKVGFFDLYGDGSLETISGFSDETWRPDPKNPLYYGNERRSRDGEDYMVFSSNPNTALPEGLKFVGATIIPSDLNGDGIDDITIIQSGPDYAPYVNSSNYVFLSSPNGYTKRKLPGPKAVWHGGAVGDIDNDGDLDIVATPGDKNRVAVYYNKNGNFTYKEVIGRNGGWETNARYYQAQLWDIDKDGYLDLFIDGHEESAAIYWGNGKAFDVTPTLIPSLEKHFIHDTVFVDIDNDGAEEIVALATIDDGKWFYAGWGLYTIEVNGRIPQSPVAIREKRKEQWLPFISGCDLKNDGDIDIVLTISGQLGGVFNPRTTGMIVFENTNGTLTYNDLKSPMYYEELISEATVKEYVDELISDASAIGVDLNGYVPSQVYYPTPDNNKRYLKGDPLPAKFLLRGQYY